jgi:Carboxypeptidase regulatory-like domain
VPLPTALEGHRAGWTLEHSDASAEVAPRSARPYRFLNFIPDRQQRISREAVLGNVGGMRRLALVVAFLTPAIVLPAATYLLVHSGAAGPPPRVRFAQIQALFARAGCEGCHPGVNPSLNLLPGHSYTALVNVRALEDPHYAYVVAGDPRKSFLYLKVAGFGKAAQVGGRMPFLRRPLSKADLQLLADWIDQGARGPGGSLPPRSVAPLPGEPNIPKLPSATTPNGTGTISGTVIDQARRPIPGALVTLLLRGPSQPGGEQHYKVAATNNSGRYVLRGLPAGTFELKAYSPHTIYTSHFAALEPGGSETIDFGLANRALTTPSISNPRVTLVRGGGERLSMTVTGPHLDPNYTLVANTRSGRVFEVHAPGARPGVWSRTLPFRLPGPWTFFAVDRLCDASQFLTVSG